MSHRTRFLQILILALAGWMMWASTSVARAQGNARIATEVQINSAIGRAQKMILSRLRSESEARVALAITALIKSGVDPKSPEIQEQIQRLARRFTSMGLTQNSTHHIYDEAVTLLAFSNVDAKLYRAQIDALAQYIIDHQGKFGQWHYPNSVEGDTSISQYALLGLWEASRCGFVVPNEVWDKAANWHIKTQQRDGGFAYHPNEFASTGQSMHSMTAAGIGSLRITRRYLFPNARERTVVIDAAQPKVAKKNRSGKRFGILEPFFREEESADSKAASRDARVGARNASYVPQVTLAQIDDAVDKGVNWMATQFTVDKPKGYPIYFLYSLERASTLAELTHYGDHDWYEEGAAHLVATQDANSAWVDSCGEVPATAFGVLFLAKATSKMVEHDVPRVEFGTGILVGGRGLPDDLKASTLNDGKVKKDKKTPLEELLAQLENPQIPLLESTQAEIVEQVVIGDRNKLIGQVDRLKRLAKHPDAEVRRTALWALGRSDDLRLAPILVAALKDTDIDVFVEARNALRCLSRQVEDFTQKEGPLDAASREREWKKWRDWYRSVRAYDERDDLIAPGDKN